MRSSKVCAIVGNVNCYSKMGALTKARPLATLPFAGKYRILDFHLSNLANAGIRDVYLLFRTTEMNSVFDHLGSGKEWGLDTLLSHYFFGLHENVAQNPEQGLRYYLKIIDFLKKSNSQEVVFLGSNLIYNIDLKALIAFHRSRGRKMTVAFKKVKDKEVAAENYLLKLDENGSLIDVDQKKNLSEPMEAFNLDMEVFVLDTQWLIERLTAQIQEFLPESLQTWLNYQLTSEIDLAVYEYMGYLSNIYDIKSYYDANMELLNPNRFISLLYGNQRIYTKVKNEVPTHYSATSNVNNSHVATGSIIKGTVSGSILSRRNYIAEGVKVNNSILFPEIKIETGAQINFAIIDKNVEIKAGIKVSGTVDHPLVIEKGMVVSNDLQVG